MGTRSRGSLQQAWGREAASNSALLGAGPVTIPFSRGRGRQGWSAWAPRRVYSPTAATPSALGAGRARASVPDPVLALLLPSPAAGWALAGSPLALPWEARGRRPRQEGKRCWVRGTMEEKGFPSRLADPVGRAVPTVGLFSLLPLQV